jgi:hypothetical protein
MFERGGLFRITEILVRSVMHLDNTKAHTLSPNTVTGKRWATLQDDIIVQIFFSSICNEFDSYL